MKKAAPALILAAGTLWGIMGIFVRKLGTYGFSSIQIASLRIIFGALIFFAITAVAKRELLKIKVQDVGIFIGMGLISLLLFTICYFTTINMASLSVAAILLYTSPIWVMLMSLVCFREKMTKRKVLAVVMAFVGCVLVSGIGGATQLSFKIIGIGLMSAVGYGLYSIFGTFALRIFTADGYHLRISIWGDRSPVCLQSDGNRGYCLSLGRTELFNHADFADGFYNSRPALPSLYHGTCCYACQFGGDYGFR